MAVITLDHTEVGNALSGHEAARLADVLDDISQGDDGIRAVLLRAEGKHFCTGADLSSGASRPSKPTTGHMVRTLDATHHRAVAAAFNCRVPLVAAVQGTAQGFGLHLALAADFAIAAEGATFRAPFTDRGFSVDSGGSWLLPRLIGLTRAKQLLYLADLIDAATAAQWGLVHQVVAAVDLDPLARALTSRLAAGPTQAIAATKRLLHDHLNTGLEVALHDESMAVELTIRSTDFKEGLRAFAERRPPVFEGT